MGRRLGDLSRQDERTEHADGKISGVELPPLVPVPRRARVRMMIVVPALAVGHESDQDVVAAVFAGFIVAVAPAMSDGIDRPGRVPVHDGAHENAPYQETRAELAGGSDAFPGDQSNN